MFSYFDIAKLPDFVSPFHAWMLLGSWFGMGLVEPLRAGLAVASVWPLAVQLSRLPSAVSVTIIMLVALLGIWAADAWETLIAVKDDRRIVIDEVVGYLAGMALIGRSGWLAAGAFGVLFLALDRLKPWPFSRVEEVPGGLGIMLDDSAAGLALGLTAALVMALWRRIGRARSVR